MITPLFESQIRAFENIDAAFDKHSFVELLAQMQSGKTETFLYSIIGLLALEANRSPKSFSMPGVRALLLYPMNALVSDQTARLRRLLGDEKVAELMRRNIGV